MYILKNALTSIKRNPGRNILVGIIIIVISCFLTISLAIKNTSDALIKSYEEASEVTATINFNRGNMIQKFDPSSEENFEDMKSEFNNISSFSFEDVKNYGTSAYVKNYYYTASLNIDTNLEAASSEFSFAEKENGGRKNTPNKIESKFSLSGYSSIEAMQEFIKGKYSITSSSEDLWSKILDGKYCLINYELATLNEIEIGDSIKVLNEDNELVSLEVLGIFKENSNDDSNGMSMFSNSANTIITNAKLVEELTIENEDLKAIITPYFILNSKDDLGLFQSELLSKGLNENYEVTTNEDEIASATSSVKNVSTFATTFLIITIIIGAIVLCILNFINIRERKYEIGVLRTIGMKKSSVATKFMLELLIVSLASLVIGAGLGSVLSKPISNSLLANEISSSNRNQEEIQNNFGRDNNAIKLDKIGGVVNIEAFDSINAIVNITVIIELIGISLLLTIISSTGAIVNIVRFRPLSILKERS